MKFRKAVKSDINSIMNIIQGAQSYFKAQGINQWQNNYPNYETISSDIENGYGYVLLKNNMIIGTVAIVFDGEETYNSIYNGSWLSNGEYTTIHRIAVDTSHKGLGIASTILKNIEEMSLRRGIRSIRVDTHEKNISMLKFLEKNGFQHCGIIYLKDKSQRIAFEKIL